MSLALVIGLAMQHAREEQGYGFARIDQALAQALVAEATQRAAMVCDDRTDRRPEREAVAEILDLVLEDIRTEARKALWGQLQ